MITFENYLFEGKLKFIGTCDRIRKTTKGEDFWQDMMANREAISEKDFLKNVDLSDMLDDGETWDDYKSGLSDDIDFYKSGSEYFFQTAGFEFIWAKNKIK